MLRTLRRFLALAPAERWLVLEAVVVLALVTVALRVWSLATARRFARWLAASRRSTAQLSVARLAWALAAVGRRLPGGRNCLAEALAGLVMLRRSGRPARLRIGVARRVSGSFVAHAWVECDGFPVVGAAGAPALTPLPALEEN